LDEGRRLDTPLSGEGGSSFPTSYLGPVGEDTIQIRTGGWNTVIEREISHRWPPVFRDWFPQDKYGLDWHWKFFQYVFPKLANPRQLAPIKQADWSASERELLGRYFAHARNLAGTTLLSARDGYRVSVEDSGAEAEIVETASHQDSTIGFLTMFRQCYSPMEPASFKRAYDVLEREIHRQGTDLSQLKAWRGAHGQLRATRLDHLILVQAARDGIVPTDLAKDNASHPSHADSPEVMLSAILYGDAIHWGDKRAVIEAREHPIIAARRRFDPLRAAVQLGHFYVGFAGIVGILSGAVSASEL
jgi:hypothetical protein